MTRQLRVFLCHASQDKPAVRELYQRLKAEDWIDPWLDEEKLTLGQHWTTEIEEALDDADVVIIFLSRNSVKKEGFIQRELNYAWEISLEKPREYIFLIPFRLDDCEIPRHLKSRQWGDYFGEKKESTSQVLLRSLKQRHLQKMQLEAIENAEREKEEQEGKEKTERDRIEREAREKIESEQAEKLALAKAKQQAKEKHELEEKTEKERLEHVTIEKAKREQKEREAKELADKIAREKQAQDETNKRKQKEYIDGASNLISSKFRRLGIVVAIFICLFFVLLGSIYSAAQQFLNIPTATSQSSTVPIVTVRVNTNCRTGPGPSYERIDELLIGQSAEIVGVSIDPEYWIIKRLNGIGTCWLLNQYASVNGNISNLPIYPIPPLPTPTP